MTDRIASLADVELPAPDALSDAERFLHDVAAITGRSPEDVALWLASMEEEYDRADGEVWPWNCPACQAQRGNGPRTRDRDRYGYPVYAQRLCGTHTGMGIPCRNRAERRAARFTKYRPAKRNGHKATSRKGGQ